MAYDADKHAIDPATGFMVDKETGHKVGIDNPPIAAPGNGAEWPKWVIPHASHVVRQGDHVVTPLFPDFHVNRADSVVTVLVRDEDEEARALADVTPVPEQPAPVADPVDVLTDQTDKPIEVETDPFADGADLG